MSRCIKYLLAVLFILSCSIIVLEALTIGAFNVQVFGTTKIANPDVVAILVQIFRRYDLALIQEIRDSSQTAVFQLLDKINAYDGPQYSLILSDRLGRTASKEQYGFFYKDSEFTHLAAFQYNDTLNRFERPPFPNLWKINANGFQFFTIPIHTSPDYAVSEIDALADVFDETVQNFGEQNGLVMGDFNGGCTYVSQSAWSSIRLRNESRFVWLIPDSSDTTTTTTICPYDRFVVNQGPLKDLVYNATIFTYDTYFNLNYTQATAVSDHYSIELNLNIQSGPAATPSMAMEKKGKNNDGTEIQFYHEKQSLQRCAVHAINNLLQNKIYSAKDLDAIANSFSNAWINPHKSVLGLGNYDANVLIKAIEDQGFEVKWFDKRKSTKDLDLDTIFGLILNYKSSKFMGLWKSRHWVSARKMNGLLYVFDSVRSKPASFGNDDAREFLQKMIDDADSEILMVFNSYNNNRSSNNNDNDTANKN